MILRLPVWFDGQLFVLRCVQMNNVHVDIKEWRTQIPILLWEKPIEKAISLKNLVLAYIIRKRDFILHRFALMSTFKLYV